MSTRVYDPKEPSRGPGRMGELYLWEREGDLPIIGVFAGVVLGARKGADTLDVRLEHWGGERSSESIAAAAHVRIRYEHLVCAIPARPCDDCDAYAFRSLEKKWECSGCGKVEEE